MNTQIERTEEHTARLTIEVDPTRLERAKQQAAQKISRQVNIPGFRKGKAPYRVLVSYIGEGAILDDALEILGNEIYKEALSDNKDIEPYGPGQLEDVKLEDKPVFTFIVPLQPSVALNEYREVRLPFEAPQIEDRDVDAAMRNLLEQNAVVEESTRPVAAGNRVTMFIDGRVITDGAEAAPDTEAAGEAHDHAHEGDDHDHDHDHDHGDEGGDGHEHHVDENTVIHEHDGVMLLTDDNEPVPGFIAALAGAAIGERRTFELTYPDDAEEYEELAGKRVRFDVEIKKIEHVTLPALNDDFAARVTSDEEKPLTLLELRVRVRENLAQIASERATNEYSRQALDAIVAQADVRYPEALVAEQIQEMIQRFDQELRSRRLTLDDYKKIYRKTDEDLYNEYRPAAVRTIERSLVMGELAASELLTVAPEQIEAEIDKIVARFGGRADDYRRLFDTPDMRRSLVTDLLNQNVLERIVAIAKGEAPELNVQPEPQPEVAEDKGEAEE